MPETRTIRSAPVPHTPRDRIPIKSCRPGADLGKVRGSVGSMGLQPEAAFVVFILEIGGSIAILLGILTCNLAVDQWIRKNID